MFSANGCLVDGETYTNLYDARDAAFNYSEEVGMDISICEEFGLSSHVIEVIEG
jgi:hypothetical protein